MNGDLRVAYRASREGPRDIVFVPNWFTNCELVPELPSLQGWVDAMTSLGRLIFFDQPGTGASDPVSPGALPTLEQWADSITAVLDDLGAAKRCSSQFPARSLQRRCSPRRIHHAPPRWSCSRAMRIRRASPTLRDCTLPWSPCGAPGEIQHVCQSGHAVERGDPGILGSHGTPCGEPGDRRPHAASDGGDGRPGGATDSRRANPCPPAHR